MQGEARQCIRLADSPQKELADSKVETGRESIYSYSPARSVSITRMALAGFLREQTDSVVAGLMLVPLCAALSLRPSCSQRGTPIRAVTVDDQLAELEQQDIAAAEAWDTAATSFLSPGVVAAMTGTYWALRR